MYNISNEHFTYKNKLFNYCINSHNTRGSLTERVVEIPLLKFYLDNIDNPIEIGCVSTYYFLTKHKIYDLTDNHPSCININAKNIDITNVNIISISTIEHFDVDNYNISTSNYIDSFQYIKNIIQNSRYYLITIPLGYNVKLTTNLLNDNQFDTFIARSNDGWIQKTKAELSSQDMTYNHTVYFANSICVIENIL